MNSLPGLHPPELRSSTSSQENRIKTLTLNVFIGRIGMNCSIPTLFRDLNAVGEATYWWMMQYNEQRPHDSLDDLTPVRREAYARTIQENLKRDAPVCTLTIGR